jgi:hypothetical protein
MAAWQGTYGPPFIGAAHSTQESPLFTGENFHNDFPMPVRLSSEIDQNRPHVLRCGSAHFRKLLFDERGFKIPGDGEGFQ